MYEVSSVQIIPATESRWERWEQTKRIFFEATLVQKNNWFLPKTSAILLRISQEHLNDLVSLLPPRFAKRWFRRETNKQAEPFKNRVQRHQLNMFIGYYEFFVNIVRYFDMFCEQKQNGLTSWLRRSNIMTLRSCCIVNFILVVQFPKTSLFY